MDLLFSVSAFPGITDPVIFRAYETTAPNTVVASSTVYNTPHGSPRNIVIAGVNPVPHIIKLFVIPGGAGTGTSILEFWKDPTFLNLSEEIIFFKVDAGGTYDPAAGTNSFTHPHLVGLNAANKDYTVERRGVGTLDTTEIVSNIVAGSFTLVAVGDMWQSGEVGVVRIAGTISTATPIVANASLFTDIVALSADTTLDSTYLRKLISLASSTNKITITLDILSNFPNNAVVSFITHQSSQLQATIQANGSELIWFNQAEVNKLYMGAGEELWLTKKGNRWYILKSAVGMLSVGEVVYAHKLLPNTLKCEGQILDRVDYPRLWSYIQSLNTESLVTDTAWLLATTINPSTNQADLGYGIPTAISVNLKKGCFSNGNGTTTFRVPDLRDQFIRSLKGTGDLYRSHNYPGGAQFAGVGPHEHAFGARADNAALAYNTRTITTRPVEDFTVGVNANVVHLTDKVVGSETRVDNIGLLGLIKI